ncbi:glycosyltransferase [Patescibacteria group bacterium]
MKIALVCDDLIQHGGHEKVVLDFCEIFPDAILHTTAMSESWEKKLNEKNIKYVTSFMQKFPFKEKLARVYAPFLFYILALENFEFDDYDVVISLSSRFAHGVITKPNTKHICYMSTVGRMFWEPASYFEKENFGGTALIKSFGMLFLKPFISYIRLWDKLASQRVDYFIANSITTQKRIEKYYKRKSEVIHPSFDLPEEKLSNVSENYFLVLTRLAPWKRVDIAVKSCLKLNLKLKVLGDGPAKADLEVLAKGNENIELLGYVSEKDKSSYLKECKALINTQYEDFGIVPLEAMYCGKPIIAYAKGGVLETVIPDVTGVYFTEQSERALSKVLIDFDEKKFLPESCREQAMNFSKERFIKEITDLVVNYAM